MSEVVAEIEHQEAGRSVADEDSQCAEQSGEAFAEKAGASPTGRGLLNRLKENQYRCELSGVLLTIDVLSLDHAIPLTSGGEHSEDNLLLVHAVVNLMKGRLSRKEFIQWCRAVADHADRQGTPR